MVYALNHALKNIPDDYEIIIFTDTDAVWPQNALKEIIAYFADSSVGCVTSSILPEQKSVGVEYLYRDFYNLVRVAESKIHSTPIHNGVLVAFRHKLLTKIGGLPTYTGNADSTPASLIAFMGYRAIQADNVVAYEPVIKEQFKRKIRRAQHLILHFLYTKRYAKRLGIYKKSRFDVIWGIESFLHLVNPWLLLVATILLIYASLQISIAAIILLTLGAILTLWKTFRVWLQNQVYLIIAFLKNIYTKEMAWEK